MLCGHLGTGWALIRQEWRKEQEKEDREIGKGEGGVDKREGQGGGFYRGGVIDRDRRIRQTQGVHRLL